MAGFERSLADGTVELTEHSYADEDIQGEANLIGSMFDWIEDPAKPSFTCLTTALNEWQVILAGYLSTVEARPVDLPFDPPVDLLDQFKRFVGAG
jgi:hypothetical protein